MSKFELPHTTIYDLQQVEPGVVPKRMISGHLYFAVAYYAPDVDRCVVSLPVTLTAEERHRVVDLILAALVEVRA